MFCFVLSNVQINIITSINIFFFHLWYGHNTLIIKIDMLAQNKKHEEKEITRSNFSVQTDMSAVCRYPKNGIEISYILSRRTGFV